MCMICGSHSPRAFISRDTRKNPSSIHPFKTIRRLHTVCYIQLNHKHLNITTLLTFFTPYSFPHLHTSIAPFLIITLATYVETPRQFHFLGKFTHTCLVYRVQSCKPWGQSFPSGPQSGIYFSIRGLTCAFSLLREPFWNPVCSSFLWVESKSKTENIELIKFFRIWYKPLYIYPLIILI